MTSSARRVPARHHIEELAAGDVHDLGRPHPMPEPPESTRQHLIQPDSGRGADPVRVIDQGPAVMHDGIHHRVSVTAEIASYLADRASVMADLERRPPTGPIIDRSPPV